jgi:subtilase family serine protease
VAAAGDDGYGTQFPASSQFVTAVGGTTLTTAPGTTRGWTESVWAGTGAGCSAGQVKPSWQSDSGCADRTQNDVAADADPDTGVVFYDTDGFGGWGEGGGTNGGPSEVTILTGRFRQREEIRVIGASTTVVMDEVTFFA